MRGPFEIHGTTGIQRGTNLGHHGRVLVQKQDRYLSKQTLIAPDSLQGERMVQICELLLKFHG